MNKVLNQKGEAFVMIFLMIFAAGSVATYVEQERKHKKEMHYEQYHKDAKKKEQELQEALEKAKRYKI